jgi:hypothetical protein
VPGRIRTIKPELLEDEKTSALDHEAFRLFVGLILLADDYGNARASGRYLNGAIFHSCGRVKGAIADLNVLAKIGLVALYEVGEQAYVHIRGWEKHQRVDKPGKARCPSFKDSKSLESLPDEPFATDSRPIREPFVPDPDPDPDLRPVPPTTTTTTTGGPGVRVESRSDKAQEGGLGEATAMISGWYLKAKQELRGIPQPTPDPAGAIKVAHWARDSHRSFDDVEWVIRKLVSDNERSLATAGWPLSWLLPTRADGYFARRSTDADEDGWE